MYVQRLMALLMALCLLLSGCGVTSEVENQAYVLVLGVDRLDGGKLEVSARVPKVGKDVKEDETSSGGDYLTFSASGTTWAHTLEALQLATPRQINLSHISMLVVSEALAREAEFSELIREIAETPHLYTTARFVICAGTARDFVQSQELILGTRLSSELTAMLRHYTEQGYIPGSTFADVYYATNSIYSDPIAIWGEPNATGDSGDIEESPMSQRYSGAAVFHNGVLAEVLTLEETRLLSLILRTAKSMPFDLDGTTRELTLEGKPQLDVVWSENGIKLTLAMIFTAREPLPEAEIRLVETALGDALTDLIAGRQRHGLDPFGFSEVAAGHFLTVPEWLNSGWRQRYAAAEREVSVYVKSP